MTSRKESLTTEVKIPLRDCEKSKDVLTVLLNRVWQVQKRYGDEAENFRAKEETFQWMLADYCIEDISWAFKRYMTDNSDLPAPASIIGLISGRHGGGTPTLIEGCKSMEELQEKHRKLGRVIQ